MTNAQMANRLQRKLKALRVERTTRVRTNMPVGVPLNRQIRKVVRKLEALTS